MTILDSNTIPSGGSSVVTTTFRNIFTVTNTSSGAILADLSSNVDLSGSLTSGGWKTMINITGSAGKCPVLAIRTTDVTARVISLRITRDGAYVTTITSSSISTVNHGIVAAGSTSASTNLYITDGEPISWKTSFLVEIQGPTETDKIELISKTFSEA